MGRQLARERRRDVGLAHAAHPGRGRAARPVRRALLAGGRPARPARRRPAAAGLRGRRQRGPGRLRPAGLARQARARAALRGEGESQLIRSFTKTISLA